MTWRAHLLDPIETLEDLIFMVVELLLCQNRSLAHRKHGKIALSIKKIAQFIASNPELYEVYIDLCYERYEDKDKAYRSCIANGSITIRNTLLKIIRDEKYKGPAKDYIKHIMILGIDGVLGEDPCHVIIKDIETKTEKIKLSKIK